MTSIWKDYYVILSTEDSVLFRIRYNGQVIYQGRAHKKPGAADISIRVNDICADYLRMNLPDLTNQTLTNSEYSNFYVEIYSGSSWVAQSYVSFINDWSYESGFNPASARRLSFPINGKLAPNQLLFYTSASISSYRIRLSDKSGIYSLLTVSVPLNQGYPTGVATYVIDMANRPNVTKVIADTAGANATYEVVQTCARYALYYVNAYGGWDSMLIEGNDKMTDNYTRHDRDLEYDNRDAINRGRETYAVEIQRSHTFYTGYLTDDEASRMHHLFGSTNVYLCDLETREFLPVTVSSAGLDYKTYKNNGNKLIQYTIDVQLAQERMRK